MSVLISSTWPLNKAGEVVLKAGTGDSSISTQLSQDQLPIDPSDGSIAVSGVAGFKTGLAEGITSGGSISVPTKLLTPKRYEALMKPLGCTAAGKAFGLTGADLSTTKFTYTAKVEVEAEFDAVKFLAINRATNAISGLTVLVGVTETADLSTSAKLASPTIKGVTYQALQGAANVNGWRSVTWSTGATGAVDAAPTMLKASMSNWAAKGSIPRADGGTRPFLMYRAYIDGTVTPFGKINGIVTVSQPTANMRGRVIQTSINGSADGITDPTVSMTLFQQTLEVYPVIRFRKPVTSVWTCGDSMTQNDALVPDTYSSWGMRACLNLSTPDTPVIYANLGCSSQPASVYIEVCRTVLAAGAPPPTILFLPPASINDAAYDPNLQEQQFARITEVAKLCVDYKIPYFVFLPIFPNDSLTLAQDNMRKATNARLKASVEQLGGMFMDVEGISTGASPDRWLPEYRFDNVHFNAKCIEEKVSPAASALIKPCM